ncbi:MAG TPA: sigma-70 family RNA polymerase sigma factor [Ktedonobacterales bacterium]
MNTSRARVPVETSTFAALVNQTQRALYGYLRGLMADEEQARDLMQDVFCDAWRAAKQGIAPFDLESDERGRQRWLFHVAHHKAVSALRHRSLIRWEPLEEPKDGEDRFLQESAPFEEQIVEGAVLQAALASLTLEEASCLLLNVVQGFPSAEIAQIVHISPEACKKRLSRARQRLRAAYLARAADGLEEASSS